MKKQSKPLTRKKPMKRTGFKKKTLEELCRRELPTKRGYRVQYAPLINKLPKPRKRIRPVSKKRQKENSRYLKIRKEFLIWNYLCMVDGCGKMASEVHHKKGREGKWLCDSAYFMPVCSTHHQLIHENPSWAKIMGYILGRK